METRQTCGRWMNSRCNRNANRTEYGVCRPPPPHPPLPPTLFPNSVLTHTSERESKQASQFFFKHVVIGTIISTEHGGDGAWPKICWRFLESLDGSSRRSRRHGRACYAGNNLLQTRPTEFLLGASELLLLSCAKHVLVITIVESLVC